MSALIASTSRTAAVAVPASAMRLARAALGAGVSAAILFLPRAGMACAVCTAGRDDESNAAFLVSTIFLSLLPLVALGTFVYVLWRRFQKLEQSREGSSHSPRLSPQGAAAAEPSGAGS